MSVKPKKGPKPTAAPLVERIRGIWEGARTQAARSVDTAHVMANWLIGREIVEEEQEGRERAVYGKQMLKVLAAQLQAENGHGFSYSSLKYIRLFFVEYPDFMIGHPPGDQSQSPGASSQLRIRYPAGSKSPLAPVGREIALRGESAPGPRAIGHPVGDQLDNSLISKELGIHHPAGDEFGSGQGSGSIRPWKPGQLHSNLSWRHYRTLLRARRPGRDFYEIEAVKNGWTGRQLERQINTLLYERLAKSRDKAGVMALAQEGQVVQRPVDLLREPFVLEFLNLPESHLLTETDLETALLGQLQAFLLELGEGFAFIGRQRRLTLEGDHFYPDLVFYHIRLRCYVIIDLKVNKLDHSDLGQMLLYVNYYDREVRGEGDQPTVGLILCTDQNETVAKYVLDEKAQRIFASRYQAYLPSVEQLEAELRRERERIESAQLSPLAAVRKTIAARKVRAAVPTKKAKKGGRK